MPVYNALPHLDAAVRSILDQSYRDFEFVIYDDASTDGSTKRLRELAQQDKRIRLFEGQRNLGPVGSSAFVVEHSTGELIARMDADDTCSPDRLERHLQAFRDNPEVGLVGTLFNVIDDQGTQIRGPDLWRLARRSALVPFAHGSIMFRRSVFEQAGGYRPECEFWEDQDVIVRMAAVADVLAIPEGLYQVRQWKRNIRASSDPGRVETAVDLMYRCVARLEKGEDYDDLLRVPRDTRRRLDPRVFIAGGSLALWAGRRPKLLGRVLKRARLRLDLRSASAILWTTWAASSPTTLRSFLRLWLRARNLMSSEPKRIEGLIPWRLPVPGR